MSKEKGFQVTDPVREFQELGPIYPCPSFRNHDRKELFGLDWQGKRKARRGDILEVQKNFHLFPPQFFELGLGVLPFRGIYWEARLEIEKKNRMERVGPRMN
jgi:hypothetical protein